MAKILSKNINVYPTGFRGLYNKNIAFDPESIYNTEDNLTRPYKFISNGDYVINDTYTEGGKFELILGGYYFNIRKFNIPADLKDKSELFAHIKIEPKGDPDDEDNTKYIANALRPLDLGNVDDLDSEESGEYYFDGLIIDDIEDTTKYSKTLLILEKSGESWIVPEKSKLRFSPRHIEGGTDYNTHSTVGLNNQLDTKLVYNPDGNLTIQGKDQVEIKSVDSSATAKVSTVWNTSAESIVSEGKKIEASVNELSTKNCSTNMSLDKDIIQFSKVKDENTRSIIKISDDEILLENKDVSSSGPGGIAAITIKTIDGNHSSIDLGITDDVYNSNITLDQNKVEINASGAINLNAAQGTSMSMDVAGNIQLSTYNQSSNIFITASGQTSKIEVGTYKEGSPINLNTAGDDSPVNIETSGARSDISLNSSSAIKLALSKNSQGDVTKGVILHSSAFEVSSDGVPIILKDLTNLPWLTLNGDEQGAGTIIPESNFIDLGSSSKPFNYGYINYLRSKQMTINGSSSNGAIRVNVGSSASSNYGLIVASSSASTATSTKISPVCVMTQSYYATSDRRLKENIKPFNYSKAITDIEVKEFNFKGDKNKTIGIIAQDLQEIYPELVHENENGYLSIQEDKLIYLLLEEVKELKKEVNNLKNIKK